MHDNKSAVFKEIAIKTTGSEALWPVYDVWRHLAEWFDMDRVSATVDELIVSGVNIKRVRKLQSIQAFAYRMPEIQ